MRSGDFIQQKLQAWAARHGLTLQGSARERGEPNYTLKVGDNIFGGELLDDVRRAFECGAGQELKGDPASMQALHSSAAMAVNLFQYWMRNRQFAHLARILRVPSSGIESVQFECKYPVCDDPEDRGFRVPPHLDLGIEYSGCQEVVGVECKLFEPYGRLEHHGLAEEYLELSNSWNPMPCCKALAEQLVEGAAGFLRLGPVQLLRHILGLRHKTRGEFRLIYLYMDAPGEEASEHRAEIARFADMIRPDGIRFVPMTVQRFILRGIKLYRSEHAEYFDYLSSRYV